MKDLIIIITTTLIVALIWIGTETHNVASRQIVTDELLEISTPFNGRIDVDYLNNLEEPAYDN